MALETICRDMRTIPFERRFDAVVNLFSPFGYFNSREEDRKVLSQIAKALKPAAATSRIAGTWCSFPAQPVLPEAIPMSRRPKAAKSRRPAARSSKPAAKSSGSADTSSRSADTSSRSALKSSIPALKPSRPAAESGGSATWNTQPATGQWNTATNWTPATVPTNMATFSTSSLSTISFDPNGNATVDNIAFVGGAPAYTLTFSAPAPNAPALTISGDGVTNSSLSTQQFVVASSAENYKQPQLKFTNSAVAGWTNVTYAVGAATTPGAAGGGVIGFYDTSSAGSASFTVTTGSGTPPKHNSTVGGEVGFSDNSTAGTATFTVSGTTSATDGDTFGNVAFHDNSNAANATFTNAGGTIAKGDGGNTQFFNNSSAANGLFHNVGATVSAANGGDVAFDGTATAAQGQFHNYAATASGGYGGVTSFNNNAPDTVPSTTGASAGMGIFCNYGAKASGQGGGHTYFTARYGSPTAANGTFVNYGSAVPGSASIAGHTVFSITTSDGTDYSPDAGSGYFWNFPGTAAGAPGGYTEFTVYTDEKTAIIGTNRSVVRPAASGGKSAAASAPSTSGGISRAVSPSIAAKHASSGTASSAVKAANSGRASSGGNAPSAANATCINLGALAQGAYGGQTIFYATTSAANARLVASGGNNGGYGGKIAFYDQSSGGSARVGLFGNGALNISDYGQASLTIGALELAPGIIETTVGTDTPCLVVTGNLTITASPAVFEFESGSGFAANTPYTILTAPNLSNFTAADFTGNSLNGGSPSFSIVGNRLQVTFGSSRKSSPSKARSSRRASKPAKPKRKARK